MMLIHMIVALAGTFVAGTVSGATGLAFPLIAGPIFLLTYPAPEAIALTALCSVSGQLFSIALLRRSIVYEYRLPLILPGLLGVPLGSALLTRLSPTPIHIALGILIAIAGGWAALQPAGRIGCSDHPRRASEAAVGLIGGLTGGLVGASSVVPAIWCAWLGHSKERQRAITQPFIVTMQLASLLALGAWGALDWSLPRDYALVLIPLLAGIGTGVACFHAASSTLVTRAALCVVTASGVALLIA